MKQFLSLILLATLACASACSHGSSSSSTTSSQSAGSEVASPAASSEASPAASSEASPAESSAATGPGGVVIPPYPGASSLTTQTAQGEQASISTTNDTFDTVYGWYKEHLPTGSEVMHTSAQGSEAAVFKVGDSSVTIGTHGGQTVVTIDNKQ